ncbi:MAG: phosphodiester glycosidase family protein [Planctomycetota bacterium]
MRPVRLTCILTATLLVIVFCFWKWGIPRWSSETLDRLQVSVGVELTITEFEHPDSDRITIFTVKSHDKNIGFTIDFSEPNPDVLRPDFVATGQGQHAVAMINGSYFDSSFQPVGLVVMDGQTVSKMSPQPALSGVLAITDNHELVLIPRSKYRSESYIQNAIQAGPFIVDPGGKMGIRSDDLKTAKRTAVGQSISGEIVFISTTECTLYELSAILVKHAHTLGVEGFDTVLNLDGGPSAGLYLNGIEEYHLIPETEVPNRILMLNRRR